MPCARSVIGYLIGVVLSSCLLVPVSGSSISTTAGWPACYISKSNLQGIGGVYGYDYCYSKLSYPARSFDSATYYLYCSDDHDCCYRNGFPACCQEKTSEPEVVGLVMGCVVFVFIVLLVALCIANKHCQKDETDGL